MSRTGRTRSLPPPGLILPPLDRRRFLRGAAVGGLGVGFPSLLAACGTPGTTQSADSCPSTDLSAEQRELTFSNWVEYIDPAPKNPNKPPSTLQRFEQESGITVEYVTDVNDNNDFFSKVQNQLGDCQAVGRDIFALTDWMAARMIDLGWIQELDHDNMPNVTNNLVASLRDPDWDPGRTFSVPWQSGLTGIAYNARYTDEVRSFDELLTRPDLAGRVTLLTEMRDTMGFMLRLVDADPGNFSPDEWGQAIERLESSIGHIRSFTGNDYVEGLASGDIMACEARSGDVLAMQFDNPDIKWVVPEEGLSLWSDNMMVPNKAEHKANAEALMDFYYDPVNAAQLASWVNYICPVEGAREAMEQFDPSLVDEPLIFPDEEFLAQTFAFMALPDGKARQYETEFTQAMGG